MTFTYRVAILNIDYYVEKQHVINRIKELEALEEEYKSKTSSFSVVYGRRRVGKTALLQQAIL